MWWHDPPTEDPRPAGFWTRMREALRGSEQDYTRGSLTRPIFLLAIPTVLEMVMQSAFMLVDSLFVSRLGSEAMAVVGLTAVVFSLVLTLAHGLGEATTAMVARRMGEKRSAAASRAAAQALALGSTIAVVIGILGATSAGRILSWMGASEDLTNTGLNYMAITLGGSITLFFVLIGNSILRGSGDAALALRALWLANGLNIVFDPILIFGLGPIPAFGLIGAAIASVAGWAMAAIYQVWLLSGGRTRLSLSWGDLRPDREVVAGLVRVGLPASLDNLLGSASYLLLFRIVALFGSAAMAAFTICTRLFMLAESPSWGFGNASAVLVGQNLGAGKARRAERTASRVALYNMMIQGLIGASFMLFAEPLVRLFSSDPEVIALGVSCLLWVGAGYMIYGYGNVISQSFSGAGDTVTPTLLNGAAMWLCQIPLAYVLSVTLGRGPQGVFIALLISESILALAVVIAFRRGHWKEQKI